METYIVRVNGTEYEVEVEKKGGASVPKAAAAEPQTNASKPKAAPPANTEGEPVVCGTSGKVFKIVSHEGEQVKSGDTVILLEAMKMEIPVVAPKAGTVSQITVSEGETTASGQTVAYIS
ncbi:MAG: acetyl-CoA carboxylase biotin carboxyl carrier protein subunit [Mogibacterium sp.]|nr:acetyl-CoA carboxylase biotin carboxyl carrier protein subunit [Mogibacterium sp.]